MKTPSQALIWELSRLSRAEIVLRVGAMCFFAVLLTLVGKDLGEFQFQLIRGIAVGMFMVTAPFSQTWLGELDSSSSGFSFRLGYVRPVRTTRLVLIPMVFSVVLATASYLLPALFCICLWKVRLPLLGPSLVIAVVVQLAIAIVWSLTSQLTKILGIVTLAASVIAMGIYFAMQSQAPEPTLLAISQPSYFDMSGGQYVTIAAVILFTTLATIFAVDRQRHGDDWLLLNPAGRVVTKPEPVTPTAMVWRPFRSRFFAQFWYEWRQFATRVVLAGMTIPLLVVVGLTLGNWIYPERNPNTVTWAIAILLSPFLFQVIGVEGAVGLKHIHGTTRLSQYDSTCCLSSDQLIFLKLIVVAASSLIAWIFMLAVAWIDLSLFGRADLWWDNHLVSPGLAETLQKFPVQSGWVAWLVCVCNLLLLFVSSSSGLLAFSLWLPLYYWRLVWLAIIGAVHVAVLVLAFRYGWPIQPALIAYGYIVAGIVVGLCIVAIRKSLVLGAMRMSIFLVVFGFWAIYVISSIQLYGQISERIPQQVPLAGLVLGAALLLVPLATTVVAPLAYSTHRNG